MYSSQASEDAHDEEELEDSPTEAASYVDTNDPALHAGKHPISDDDKLTLLTSKFTCPSNFTFPASYFWEKIQFKLDSKQAMVALQHI